MRRILLIATAGLLALAMPQLGAQTATLNDGSIVQASTKRIGVNIGAIDFYDNGEVNRNLVGAINPNFEPALDQQIWALSAAGTTTTFSNTNIYDSPPANFWAGATFTIVQSQTNNGQAGCTGTIASNTTGTSGTTAPSYTTSAPCGGPFSIGDVVILKKTTIPTPESSWENSNGLWTAISGGGTLTSDTTDLCATCGSQALEMNATPTSSTSGFTEYWDGSTVGSADNYVILNGVYTLSFWAKKVSGTPTLTVAASRAETGGFSCGPYTPTLTTTWQQFTYSCTTAEATTIAVHNSTLTASVSGGAVYFDNLYFGKNTSQPTVFRDEVISTLQTLNPGEFRYWVNQNAETLDNWIAPDYARAVSGLGYGIKPTGGDTVTLSLEDYLVICQYLNVEPYLEVPITFTSTDAGNLIEFLAGGSGATYGAKRIALGQTAPWSSVFSKIHLAFANESWNEISFLGQGLPDRYTTEPNDPNCPYTCNVPDYDYQTRSATIFAAMRAAADYSANAGVFELVSNLAPGQNPNNGWDWKEKAQTSKPDAFELNDYEYQEVNAYSTDSLLWQPYFVEVLDAASSSTLDSSYFYYTAQQFQAMNYCGASGTAACIMNVYEWGPGIGFGSIPQTQVDYVAAGAGQGIVSALEPLLNIQNLGTLNQNYFALTENYNSGPGGTLAKIWGSTVDMGGATNNVRPQFLGMELVNHSIIGPMFSCPISSNPTYSFAAETSNGWSGTGSTAGVPAQTVPYLYSFCFKNGTSRSLVFINTDITNAHTVSFAGTNLPAGTVTVRSYAPASLDLMNEAATGTASNTTAASVALTSSTVTSPSSITLPAHSVIALDYTVGSGTAPHSIRAGATIKTGTHLSN